MEYTQLTFITTGNTQNEMLIALLSNIGFEGFEEQETALTATIPKDRFDETAALEIAQQLGTLFTMEHIQQQNWNAIWEAGFQPVMVPGFCTIRASFHAAATNTPYEVVITPKMSFGTGHHATTFTMIEMMRKLDFNNKNVLDFGTGTGILAILAKKLGAATVLAIDNDDWSIENAIENAAVNQTELTVRPGSLEEVPAGSFDIILANINRNILLQYMHDMTGKLAAGGQLALSGILEADATVIQLAAEEAGLEVDGQKESNGWLCMSFTKLKI